MYEANRYIDLTEKKWFRTGIIIRKFLCRSDADWEMIQRHRLMSFRLYRWCLSICVRISDIDSMSKLIHKLYEYAALDDQRLKMEIVDWEMELYEPAPEEVEAGLHKVEERIRDFYK